MNRVTLIGRLTKDADVRYSTDGKCVAKYTLAVDRYKDGADFIRCVAFGKAGEFAEKYLHKGMKIAIAGRIQTGSYQDKDGKTVYTTDVIVEEHEFCEKKGEESAPAPATGQEEFMKIPDGDEELPF